MVLVQDRDTKLVRFTRRNSRAEAQASQTSFIFIGYREGKSHHLSNPPPLQLDFCKGRDIFFLLLPNIMLPTPDTSHISECVYEPAEDSYLLMDSLIADAPFLQRRFDPSRTPTPFVTEVCVGSGVVLAFCLSNAHALFGRNDVLGTGIDVNPLAAKAAHITATKALERSPVSASSPSRMKSTATSCFLDTYLADLACPFRENTIDVLLCNPPYVPSEEVPIHIPDPSLDSKSTSFRFQALATDGGVDGMEVTERLLDSLPRIMSTRGVLYLLLCAQNRPEDVVVRAKELERGDVWKAEIIMRRSDGFEKLVILRIWRGGGGGDDNDDHDGAV